MSDFNKDKSNPADFGAEASAVAAIAAVKKARVPVGGVPMPNIPRLDQAPPNPAAVAASKEAARRVLSPEEQEQLRAANQFHAGVGQAYAVNQPMARTQATNPEGQEVPINPRLAPRPEGAGLRPETIKELEGFAAATAKSSDDVELEKINKEIDDLDDVYENDEFGQRVRSLLGNKKRCEVITARCPPMSFDELLMEGSVKQRVPIIPGKFEPTFRSLQGEENVEILRLMSSMRGSEDYILDTISIFRLTAGLYQINNKVFPNHLDKNGDFDEKLFLDKKKIVSKMALPILADLSVNYNWFTRRVQKMTVVDDIKLF